jgi:hypothetical protein
MPRSLPEWKGKTDDTPVPPRVKLRVLRQYDGCCDGACNGCGRRIGPGDAWTCDHIVAIINDGENRESNLHPLCCFCHPVKTMSDLREKSRIARIALRHAGIRLRSPHPLPGGKGDSRKRTVDGRVINRATGQPWRR